MEYVYDDGSTISYDGVTVASTAATDSGIAGWSADYREAQKMSQFYGGDKPWYEQLALYGASRAIDSHFAQSSVDKTAQPATFAGQNGQTYQAGSTAPSLFSGNGGMLLIVGLAALAFVALR